MRKPPRRVELTDELKKKFWRAVDKKGEDECWPCKLKAKTYGYYQIRVAGQGSQSVYLHRISYQIAYGDIPVGMFVCHKCDNPGCVNPRHLFAGTQADNMQDMCKKKRHRHPILHGEDNPSSLLKEADVRRIWAMSKSGAARRAIAKMFGVSKKTVESILAGRNWRHVTASL